MTHYLDEIRELLKSFDKSIDNIEREIAVLKATMADKSDLENWKGQIKEMQRHNGRTIKLLGGIIVTCLSIIAFLVGM